MRAFAGGDVTDIHDSFQHFFTYLDAQKIRTPKGLDWINSIYPQLTQLELMIEMQALRQMHNTMWVESVREIVSAKQSDIKFIVTDHPVTIYNPAFPPSSPACVYPNDPSIDLKGSQTVFALDADHCLILTNLEYAQSPTDVDVTSSRTHARYGGLPTLARTDKFIRTRELRSQDVAGINRILKSRARRYVAASDAAWLEPEIASLEPWERLGDVLLPPPDELWHFGGETYVGYKDGSTRYQDQFGRTSRAHEFLTKKQPLEIPGRGDLCGCGSGELYRKCWEGVPWDERPSWKAYSIRERNLMFCGEVQNILELSSGKNWTDVRRTLSDEQVARIHEVYESLWPLDTDLVELLPRPTSRAFRGLFLGIVDPRTIGLQVTSWLSYFDQIIIPTPFVNAGTVRPEYSPTLSPSQFKSQTITNVLLLMILEPYISAGLVHLLPNPTDFGGLMHVVMKMAQERVGNMEIDPKDMDRFGVLQKDDVTRAALGMPLDALRRLVTNTSPEISPEDVEQILSHMKELHESDPLALLQELPPGEQGAQLRTVNGFNLEISLFVARLTGAVIYTDTNVHWQHLHNHTSARRGGTPLAWTPLVKKVKSARFPLSEISVSDFEHRRAGTFESMRFWWREIAAFVGNNSERSTPKAVIKKLAKDFDTAERRMRREWKAIDSMGATMPLFQGHVELSIPEAGFELATVQRLLLTYGRARKAVPTLMAMFIECSIAPDGARRPGAPER